MTYVIIATVTLVTMSVIIATTTMATVTITTLLSQRYLKVLLYKSYTP